MIRKSTPDDLATLEELHRAAFSGDEEAMLVRDLMADPTAVPLLSLLALEGTAPIGHVLFTAARLEGAAIPKRASLLAPLAVTPSAQGQGVGSALVETGLARLEATGTTLAFVFGDPAYYGRFGFKPAAPRGIQPPCPTSDDDAYGWMVRTLGDTTLEAVSGRVRCARSLERPELWLV